MDNKTVVSLFVEEVINQGRLERANDLVAEDFVELDPLPGQRQGREGLKEIIGAIRTAFPDIHWMLDEMIAEDNKVASRFTWTGTHRGSFLGIPPTNRNIVVKGVVIDRLEAGKMADSRILMDTMSMMQQLGVVPAS
ncbi:ester cyclase [Alloacidobacterium sp.]|uniref:ester cyclase n=1 Tax=Alloacidobacterium sp. TaxID=2951999 RepID=UPI002D46D884|nr:ester cyclase [Alloacidobacterium sp.]HYK37142.1 ester cyclase [Alloacidobacterium sp.]